MSTKDHVNTIVKTVNFHLSHTEHVLLTDHQFPSNESQIPSNENQIQMRTRKYLEYAKVVFYAFITIFGTMVLQIIAEVFVW